MSSLVEDLLAMARLDAGVVAPEGTTTAGLRDEIERAVATWSSTIRIDVEPGPEEEVEIRSDGLARVLDNLLGNAARYASAARIAVRRHDDRVTVHLDDDGPGIPPADRERAFDRFTRLDEARDRGSGGAGLGLAIVRATVRAVGGDVRLDDSPLGGLRVAVKPPPTPSAVRGRTSATLEAREPVAAVHPEIADHLSAKGGDLRASPQGHLRGSVLERRASLNRSSESRRDLGPCRGTGNHPAVGTRGRGDDPDRPAGRPVALRVAIAPCVPECHRCRCAALPGLGRAPAAWEPIDEALAGSMGRRRLGTASATA